MTQKKEMPVIAIGFRNGHFIFHEGKKILEKIKNGFLLPQDCEIILVKDEGQDEKELQVAAAILNEIFMNSSQRQLN